MKLYKTGCLVLLLVLILTVLFGCKENQLDERAVVVDSGDYTDCPKHNITLLDFYEPDTITLIRDGTVIKEYPKGNAIYEKILQMQETALENYYQDYITRTGEKQVSKIKGIFGQYLPKTGQTYLTEGIYLIYTYTDNTYAPVYFQINNPTANLSTVISVQDSTEGSAFVPYGFATMQELWNYLLELKK